VLDDKIGNSVRPHKLYCHQMWFPGRKNAIQYVCSLGSTIAELTVLLQIGYRYYN